MSVQRHLDWPGCYNIRDLGGLPASDGRETKWRSIIRSDQIARLTAEGQRRLLAYGVLTIIDLRTPDEIAGDPSARFSSSVDPPTYLALPLEKYYPHVSALIRKAKSRGEVYKLILEHYPGAVADVMRAITNAQPGGVLVHCHSGTDRTGIVAAILLRLAGVSQEKIVTDYGESQLRLSVLYEKIREPLSASDQRGLWSRPTATPDQMALMLSFLDTHYHGVGNYLRQAGLTEAELSRLKQRILSPSN